MDKYSKFNWLQWISYKVNLSIFNSFLFLIVFIEFVVIFITFNEQLTILFSNQFHIVQSIPGLQTTQGNGGGQQQNVVMMQPQSNLTSVTSSPVGATNVSNALVQSVPNGTNGIQTMANAQDSQPITITNAQGQQITVIPTQALQQLRPANANIIQMPNMSGLQAIPVQNIPGLGNVQVKRLFFSFSRKKNAFNLYLIYVNRWFLRVHSMETMFLLHFKLQIFLKHISNKHSNLSKSNRNHIKMPNLKPMHIKINRWVEQFIKWRTKFFKCLLAFTAASTNISSSANCIATNDHINATNSSTY